MHTKTLTLVGCGAMGSALIQGWLSAGLQDTLSHLTIITPHPDHVKPFLNGSIPVIGVDSPAKLTQTPDILFFAVKPQVLGDIIQSYQAHVSPHTLIMSVVAGKELSVYQKAFPGNPIVRAMPNTPATIGQAMTGLLASGQVSLEDRSLAEHLMQAVGRVVWVGSDEDIDKVTAVSGCGPAYVFLLTEALEKAACSLGFSPAVAVELAQQTVVGSAAYLGESSDSPQTLRQKVTSPGGMTEAALGYLQGNDRFAIMIEEAVKTAYRRAAKLK
jgi:pyrroline-5-carboxylate reductase